MISDLRSRIYGCLLGVAVGDALGMPSSFLPPAEIKRSFGRISNFEEPPPDHIYHAGYKAGQVTDDTEQTLLIADELVASGSADPVRIAGRLLEWFERVGGLKSDAVGPSSKVALAAIARGVSIEEAGKRGSTNGAAMRISPVGILNAYNYPNIDCILADVKLVCMPTHGSNLAISGAGALACGVAAALNGSDLEEIITASILGARSGEGLGFPVIGPSVARRIEMTVGIVRRHRDIEIAAREIYSSIGAGVAIAESVPAAIGLFYAANGSSIEAMLAAVNMGGDCDTVASMAGALAGAHEGFQAIPPDWIDKIEIVNRLNLSARADELFAATQGWKKEAN